MIVRKAIGRSRNDYCLLNTVMLTSEERLTTNSSYLCNWDNRGCLGFGFLWEKDFPLFTCCFLPAVLSTPFLIPLHRLAVSFFLALKDLIRQGNPSIIFFCVRCEYAVSSGKWLLEVSAVFLLFGSFPSELDAHLGVVRQTLLVYGLHTCTVCSGVCSSEQHARFAE